MSAGASARAQFDLELARVQLEIKALQYARAPGVFEQADVLAAAAAFGRALTAATSANDGVGA